MKESIPKRDERYKRLYELIEQADKEASATEAAAKGMEDVKRRATDRLKLARQAVPATAKDVDLIATEIERLQLEVNGAIARLEYARVATVRRQALRERWPDLFGLPEGAPISQQLPEAVRQELFRLGLSENRAYPEIDATQQPRVRVSTSLSFSQGS